MRPTTADVYPNRNGSMRWEQSMATADLAWAALEYLALLCVALRGSTG